MLAYFRLFRSRQSLVSHLRDTAMFVACYLALDWTSYIYPLGPFNITPWNPPPALSIVWMMLGGISYAPLVFTTLFLSDLLVRHAPGGLLFSALASLVLTAGYAAMAAALRHLLQFDYRLSDTREVWTFVCIATVGSAVVGLAYVGLLWLNNFVVDELFSVAFVRFWLGDAVGVMVTAPLLLLAADPAGRDRLLKAWRKPETIVQFAVMIVTVTLVFKGSGANPSQYFYLLFLPLIWIALRGGFAGAVVASGVVQVGVVLGMQGGPLNALKLVELQALMAAFSLTALFLGVTVDARARALGALKVSLRLATASEMAGAIAHEINQPIGAIRNYGSVCRLLLARGDASVPYAELNATIEKIIGESTRAAKVLGNLRDFFQTGTTRLEHVTVSSLLDYALRTGKALNAACTVEFRVEPATPSLIIMADRLQIELILRNLITNAFEAVANLPPAARKISVHASAVEGERILIRVVDSGPGLSSSVRNSLFEPLSTSKPGGMGMGLAISQSIAEAHGGSLRAHHGRQSEFRLLLPGVRNHD